ncbi:MAG: right-handed parallel beta-helix repeat-containing protein [Planctomycetota bacterium]|jgi:hypothetical protein
MRNLTLISVCLILAIPCTAETIIIDANGTGDYPTIQAAINAASDGDIIELQPGTYTGDGNRDIEFRGKAITVRSTDPNDPNVVAATVIDCQGSVSAPHRGFYFHSGEGLDSVIAGFTITNGVGPTIYIGGALYSVGGAIFCDSSSPTISHCNITGNAAQFPDGDSKYWFGSHGGGIYCFLNSNPTIRYCTITNNFAGGGRWNYGTGGGISCKGIGLPSTSSPTILCCTIANNSTPLHLSSPVPRGGGILLGESSIVSNCIISSNSSSKGAGLYIPSACHPTIRHCTITGNFGDGIFSNNSNSSISHCILWDNTGPEIVGSVPSVRYSDVQGGYAGEGNINADPCFVNPTASDYHLYSSSVCIDAGDPNFVPSFKETDIDAEPRLMGDLVDMGADEYTSVPIPFIQLWPESFDFYAPDVNGPNPESQVLHIRNFAFGTLNWEITEDCPWLEIVPNSGTSTWEPNEVTLSVDITGLAGGIYDCNLTISDSNAANSPQTVQVTLRISGDIDGLLYVPSEYETIQTAIDWALNGDRVFVAQGTYTGDGNRDLDFGGKAITVWGSNPDDPDTVAATVIDCNGTEVEPHRGFVFNSGEGSDSIVAGLTVINGYAPYEQSITAMVGGAVLCIDSSPTITKCRLEDNRAEFGGGIFSWSSNPAIDHCIIADNSADEYGGGIYSAGTVGPIITRPVPAAVASAAGKAIPRLNIAYCGIIPLIPLSRKSQAQPQYLTVMSKAEL